MEVDTQTPAEIGRLERNTEGREISSSLLYWESCLQLTRTVCAKRFPMSDFILEGNGSFGNSPSDISECWMVRRHSSWSEATFRDNHAMCT